MQATYELKPFPFRIVAIVCALLAAVVIGAAGGYWLKGFDRPGSAAAATVTTDRLPSMVGENASQTTLAASVPQASLVGENGRGQTTTERLHEGRRR
jgi:hypothetical protein